MNTISKKIAVTGLLSALAVVLSFLEGLIPPLPFMPPGSKLGLSNIVTMFAAGSIGLPQTLFIAVIKGGFAFVTRGVTAGIMSLSGGVLSAFVMWLLFKKTNASLSVTAVCGALTHNFAQLIVAYFLTSASVLFYIPFLIFFAIATGILTGLVLKLVLPPLEKVTSHLM